MSLLDKFSFEHDKGGKGAWFLFIIVLPLNHCLWRSMKKHSFSKLASQKLINPNILVHFILNLNALCKLPSADHVPIIKASTRIFSASQRAN